MKSEIAKLIDELTRIQDGDAWHGPALREILADVTAEQAAARPIPNGHSIWELALHIAAWENVFLRRLAGQAVDEPEEGDFPAIESADPEAWKQAVGKLESAHARLLRLVSGLSDSTLEETVAGKDYSVGFLLRGIVRHHVYHAGQMGLLKKLAR
jgi:uncharacterized damage-inducible protein DinB